MPETSPAIARALLTTLSFELAGTEGHGRQDHAPDHRHRARDPHQVPLVVPAGEGPVQVVDDRRRRRVERTGQRPHRRREDRRDHQAEHAGRQVVDDEIREDLIGAVTPTPADPTPLEGGNTR